MAGPAARTSAVPDTCPAADPAAGPVAKRAQGLLARAPALTLALLLGPVCAGLFFTLLPAVGWFPALGARDLSLDAFRTLAADPAIAAGARHSLGTGISATLIAFAATCLILAGWHGTRAFGLVERTLSPLLSIPHAAAAFGIAFLIAPSGWIARALSPWATGWDRPPDLLILQDASGLALTLGLAAKEVPFLLLMALAALPQIGASRRLAVAQALGYRRVTAWTKTVLPALYPQLRLPLAAILAYGMSNVDMALVLGPTTPPSLAVQVVRMMNDPDLARRLIAAAAALLQLGLVALALAAGLAAERLAALIGRRWCAAGGRGHPAAETAARTLGMAAAGATAFAVLGGLAGLALWSVAGAWTFPNALPDTLTLRTWARHGPALIGPAATTIAIAATASALALALTVACLEAEHRHGHTPGSRSLALLYLPLLVPQVAFLLGLQTLAIAAGAGDRTAAVTAAHLVFVLPYTFLSLAGPWRAWDQRHAVTARALGATPNRTLLAIRLPMLLPALLTAFAVGFAVSVGQYLPTLLVGGGRVATLTTEAVALASGADRRLIGATALAQSATVLLPFALALALPRLAFRNRRGMLRA